MGFSDHFSDRLTTFGVDALRTGVGEAIRIRGFLLLLEEELVRLIDRLGVTDSPRIAVRKARQEALLRQARQVVRSSFVDINGNLRDSLVDIAALGQSVVINSANALFGVSVLTASLNRNDLRALVRDSLVLGGPAKDWWSQQSALTQQRFANAVRLGVIQGEANQDLIKRIRGNPTGRRFQVTDSRGRKKTVREFSGGILDATKAQAEALVRTSVQAIANDSIYATYRQNDDIIKGVIALATLDGRTSDICIARSGGTWFIKTGIPFPDSPVQERFPGPPPWHFLCRTVLGPITFTWEEMLENAGLPRRKLLQDVSQRTQSSIDGLVPADLNYEQFLRTKSKAFQIDKLGPSKWRLWQDGKISLSQLIDTSGRPLTVAQLIERYG